MPSPSDFLNDFSQVIEQNGTPMTVRYWALSSLGFNEYSEMQRNNGSSTVASGGIILQPLGKNDGDYIREGTLTGQEHRAFIHGSITVNPNMEVTIGNTGSVYEVVSPPGIKDWDVSGTTIYHDCYLRLRQLSYGR